GGADAAEEARGDDQDRAPPAREPPPAGVLRLRRRVAHAERPAARPRTYLRDPQRRHRPGRLRLPADGARLGAGLSLPRDARGHDHGPDLRLLARQRPDRPVHPANIPQRHPGPPRLSTRRDPAPRRRRRPLRETPPRPGHSPGLGPLRHHRPLRADRGHRPPDHLGRPGLRDSRHRPLRRTRPRPRRPAGQDGPPHRTPRRRPTRLRGRPRRTGRTRGERGGRAKAVV
ncbi:MAG: hypothetical protein AVDCRST_MAG05-5237, partial [uncultured Rubrobacteraceae bacterium]